MKIRARVLGRENTLVTVVEDEGALPHTAKIACYGAYKGFCPCIWRYGGKYYTTRAHKEACERAAGGK